MKLIAELCSEEIIEELGKDFLPNEFNVVKKTRGIVKREDGLIALVYSGKFDSHSLVGGSVEKGETTEEAIVREVKEETGFDSKITDEVGCILEFTKRSDGRNSLILTYCYKLEAIGEQGKLTLTEKEKDQRFGLRWLSETEALKTIHQDAIASEKLGKKKERDYLFLSYSN